jgi:signal transduction histidine kinase
LIIVSISFIAIRSNLVPSHTGGGLFATVLILMLTSIIVGTSVSLIVGRIPLKAIREVIIATNRLAEGDFSARIDISFPPEFRKLTESFNRMAKELGSLEMLRTDFINNFSHEFKTPIVSIKGFAQMLKHDDLTDAEKNEYLDIIIRESERLTMLATNVLNLSKVENQTILSEKRRFNLSEQIRRCIVMLETKWEQKDIVWLLDIDEVFFAGNEEFLNQVWINLFDNAIKFTPKSGRISVVLKAFEHHIHFSIRDTGCGIPAESIGHIFDKFYQTDISRARAGNGLGLSIAKKIVELHDGSLSCRSEAEQGAEFIISLPVQ